MNIREGGMVFNPEKHSRRSVRLGGFDYGTAGAYFITICTHQRDFLFGDVVDGKMRLNEFGVVVGECWHAIPDHFCHLELDMFIVMPNHVHGIITIIENLSDVGATHASPMHAPQNRVTQERATHGSPLRIMGPQKGSIGAIVGQFKSAVTKRINILRDTPGVMVWQRNYYERIIRTDEELTDTREYIVNNPIRWHDDEHYRGRLQKHPIIVP